MTTNDKHDNIDDDDERANPMAWLAAELRTIKERQGDTKWLETVPPTRKYLLSITTDGNHRGVLAAGRVAFLVSAGGVGKSHALCQLALAVAVADNQQKEEEEAGKAQASASTQWLGTFEVDIGGRVLLIMGEEEEEEIKRRLYDAAQVMGLSDIDKKLAATNIVPMGLAGRADLALTKVLAPGEESETETAFSSTFRARLKSEKWACIIIDPLSRFAGGDVEKDNSAATRMVQVLEKFSHLQGNPTIVVAHHTRKAPRGDSTGAVEADDVRGASALKDGARFVAVLEDMERVDEKAPRHVRLRVVKNNYGTFPPAVVLTRVESAGGALRKASDAERDAYEKAKDDAKAAKKADDKGRQKEKEKAGKAKASATDDDDKNHDGGDWNIDA